MRILLLTTDFPNPFEPHRGVFNLNLARALARKHELRVVSPISWLTGLWRRKAAWRVLDGIEVHHPRYWYPPRLFRTHYSAFYWHSVRGTVARLLTRFRPDTVLGYWAHPDGEVAARIARGVGAVSAVIVGGSDVLLLPRERGRRACVERALQSVDGVLSVSEMLRQKTIELGAVPERAFVWRQGIDTARFHPGDRNEARRRLGIAGDRPVLVWVGRMVPVKGLDILLDACGLLRERGTTFRLCLVGDGPLRDSLKARAAALGLDDSVHFSGPCGHDGLGNWYRAADWMVLPSRSEGLPNVLRESLACGTPFIASRVGGVHEIAGEGGNKLVPPENPRALAEAIQSALTEERSGTWEGPRLASWEESADALVEVLESLAAARHGLAVSNA